MDTAAWLVRGWCVSQSRRGRASPWKYKRRRLTQGDKGQPPALMRVYKKRGDQLGASVIRQRAFSKIMPSASLRLTRFQSPSAMAYFFVSRRARICMRRPFCETE